MHFKSKTSIADHFGIIALVIFTLLSAWWLTYQLTAVASQLRQEQEVARAMMVAAAIDPMQLKQLHGSTKDIGSLPFESVRSDLKRMHTLTPDARFIYLMAMREGKVIFLADAENVHSADYSPPGQVYSEASEHLRHIFATGVAFMDPEPYTDRWGTWISAHAPIFDPETGEILAISGIDIPEQQWLGIMQDYRYKAMALATLIFLTLLLTFALFISRKHEKSSKNKYLELFEKQPQAVIIFDQDSLVFEEVNNTALALFGYDKKTFLSLSPWDISAAAQSKQGEHHALHEGSDVYERLFKRQDGHCFSAEVFTSGHFSLGSKVKTIAIVSDLTERKQHREKLVQLDLDAKRAEAANQAKSQFLATMSHELRTPLHGIVGLQSILSEEADYLQPEHKQHLELALHASHVLQSLIDDILDLSKIEADKVQMHSTTFNLPDTLYDALIPFVVPAQEKGVKLRLVFNHLLKIIDGDQAKIRQVLLNLVGNALKFTDKGYVCVIAHIDGDNLHIAIEDSGMGIAENQLKRLFEPFTQLSSARNQQGTGLGTTIAMRLAKVMGGDITVTSQLGVGSIFSICIPFTSIDKQRFSGEMDLSCALKSIPKAPENKEQPINLDHLTGMRVLLAEDDDISRMIAVKRLKRAGMIVEEAENGQVAWEKLQDQPFDLLLTDIRMPMMDGIELTRKVRALESGGQSSLRIVGISADVLEDVARQCLAAGMDDFISKPIDPDLLLQRLLH